VIERDDVIEDELFPFYALDALTDEERQQVDDYVAGNPEAAARLRALLAGATELAASTAPLPPSPAIKSRLMARVEADLTPTAAPVAPRPAPATTRRRVEEPKPRFDLHSFFFGRALGFAALLLLLGAFGLWRFWQQNNDLRNQLAAVEERAAALQAEADQLRSINATLWGELAARDEVLAQHRQPGAVTFAIGDATGDHPAAVGTVTLSPTGEGATLAVANLPPPEAGTTYQAWLIVGETPVSAGTFTVDAAGSGILAIPSATPGAFGAVGVSLEPAGGSETPTPDQIVLFGNVSS